MSSCVIYIKIKCTMLEPSAWLCLHMVALSIRVGWSYTFPNKILPCISVSAEHSCGSDVNRALSGDPKKKKKFSFRQLSRPPALKAVSLLRSCSAYVTRVYFVELKTKILSLLIVLVIGFLFCSYLVSIKRTDTSVFYRIVMDLNDQHIKIADNMKQA